MAKRKSSFRRSMSDRMVAGIDLGDRQSLTTVLSPTGDVVDRFTLTMNDDGYAFFASRVPRDVRIAFEATVTAYPLSRMLPET